MSLNSTVGQMCEVAGKDFKVVLITMLAMNIKLSNLSKCQEKTQENKIQKFWN